LRGRIGRLSNGTSPPPRPNDSGKERLPVQLSSNHIKPILRSEYVSASVKPVRPAAGRRGSRCNKETGVTEDEMRKRLELLKVEHRDLDAAIDALTGANSLDQLQIARLKKRKLKLRDQIQLIEDYLIPDIIA
jgi:hypothetical protein